MLSPPDLPPPPQPWKTSALIYNGMPKEDEYSDYLDLLSEDEDVLEAILRVFKDCNLNINESKTKFVELEVYIAEKHEKMGNVFY